MFHIHFFKFKILDIKKTNENKKKLLQTSFGYTLIVTKIIFELNFIL